MHPLPYQRDPHQHLTRMLQLKHRSSAWMCSSEHTQWRLSKEPHTDRAYRLRDAKALDTLPTDPAAPTITTVPSASTTSALPWGIESEYTTTQWVETWINSTSRTWVPKTVTLHFPSNSPAPRPGKGEIGMGTLALGDVGQTEVVVVGAAPTQGLGWGVGVGIVVGVMGAAV